MSDPIVSGGGAPRGPDDDIWFVIARMPGRMTGYPVNWKGAAFLVGMILGVVALGLGAAWLWVTTKQIWWFIGYWLVPFPAFFVILFTVMRAKSRQVVFDPFSRSPNVAMNDALRADAAQRRDRGPISQ